MTSPADKCGPQTPMESAWVLGTGAGGGSEGVHPHCTASQKCSAPHGVSSWGILSLDWPWELREGSITYSAHRARGSGPVLSPESNGEARMNIYVISSILLHNSHHLAHWSPLWHSHLAHWVPEHSLPGGCVLQSFVALLQDPAACTSPCHVC